ncbi:MAG TPA: hypothetical protein PLN89_02660 [Elusimicrobiota bacterium]|nr:hypothetical protein [Elusimicrobiota bacterium]
MTAKEIMRLSPDARLALEARARVGESDSVRDYLMLAAWRKILADKGMTAKAKIKAFIELFNTVDLIVESE